MSQVKALIAGLVKNPGLLKDLVEDPQGFARLAGLGEAELRSLKRVGNVVSGILNRVGGPSPPASAARPARSPSAPPCPGANGCWTGGGQGVAIAGVVSLAAVAGAVATVATVSLVALAGDNRDQTP